MNLSLHSELDRLDRLTQRPDHIAPNHWQEWVIESGVDPGIVALNVRSLVDLEIDPLTHEVVATPIHDLLNWNFTRFGQQVKKEMQGWAVSGVDPLKDCQPSEHARFKPDVPLIDSISGKSSRYFSPTGGTGCSIFLRVTWEIGLTIARRQGHEKSYAQRLLQAYEASETKAQSRETSGAITEIGDFSKAVIHPGSRRVASPVLPPRSFLCTDDSTFWQWVHSASVGITLTEGEKKAGCLLAQGVVAIALPGITMGVRTKDEEGKSTLRHLSPELQHFATEGREISICFDYETKPKTRHTVEFEIEKLKIQLSKARCLVKIINLPGPEKGVDDFIVAQGAEAFERVYAAALSFERWQVERYGHLNYPISLELNQRYLGKLDIPESAKLVIIRSPKGTGKTESFVDLVAEATRNGQRTLLISHRVQLAQAICDRVGLPFITEVRTSDTGSLLGYGLCIDSLHPESQARFNADHWDDALVIIDECEQVFWHALSASTEVSNHRIPVLEELKKLLSSVMESDRGRIILSDADLSNLSVEFVQALAEAKVKPWAIVNQWQPAEPWQIHHYAQKSPEQWLAALDAEISRGGRPFVVTQSQRAKGRWSTTTLERIFETRYPNKKILRIDSETIADPTHEAYLCTAHLNELLIRYDIVIASPSIETGVSIDIKGHFTSVWGCLLGVTPENSARQSLARLREAVPRHIWVRRHGLGGIGCGSTSSKALLLAEQEMARISTKMVAIINFNEDMLTAHVAALRIWAKMAARINAGKVQYRDTVLAALEAEGHHIEAIAPEASQSLMEQAKAIHEAYYKAEREAISNAEEMTQKEFEESKGKKAKSRAEAQRERKYQIQQRYQVDVSPELVEKDDNGWHAKLRLYYFLTMGKKFLHERDRQALEHVTQTSGFWLPTMNRSQLSMKVAIVEGLGIKALLDLDGEFNGGTKKQGYQNAHPSLLKIWEMAEHHRRHLRNVLGVTISEGMSPIQIAQTVLGKLGLKLTCDRQEGGKGDRQRIYRFVAPKDDRDEILMGWFTRDEVSRNDSAMHTPGINKEYSDRGERAA